MTELEKYFMDCILYCIKNPSDVWDDYVFHLDEMKLWEYYMKKGLEVDDAVSSFFIDAEIARGMQ